MAKYESLVAQIKHQIESGVWQTGDKLPSLRKQAEQSGMSLMTVLHAYQMLESQGWVTSKSRSGYSIAPRMENVTTSPIKAIRSIESIDINDFIFDVLQATRNPHMVSFGYAYPDPSLYPRQQLNKSLVAAARDLSVSNALDNLPPGNDSLRSIIAKRYAAKGMNISPDEIVITAGALEALSLSLQSVTQPGDWVIVESATFYGALQTLERLGLKALFIQTDPKMGMDLNSLEQALQTHSVKACWMMTNMQNPLGYTLSDEKKRALVELLQRYQVPLIEDDVYSELYNEEELPLPAKAFGHENIMHCSSFSKSLVAGFRIGWVAAGKQALAIQKLQLMTTVTTSVPIQLSLAHYLSTRNYESHLRQLRRKLHLRKQQTVKCLQQHFPSDVLIHVNAGGYFVWVELPKQVDTLKLYHDALAKMITIAPGKMFSSMEEFSHCFRINTSFELTEPRIRAIKMLSSLIQAQLNHA